MNTKGILRDGDETVRRYLAWILDSGNAHMTFDDAMDDFPMDQINAAFPNSSYSFWGALEHMRLTQADIIDFIRNPHYKEPNWPNDYWPPKGKSANAADWKRSVKEYKKDLAALKKILKDPKTDLYKKIPWGTGQTVIREIFLVADHTAYQLGEFATMRRVFGHWDIKHE